jgi:hypothetical protein
MERIRLNVDDLHVESFDTTSDLPPRGRGTVFGQATEIENTQCCGTVNCGTDETHCWGNCDTQHECVSDGYTCAGCGTQYTESGCTMDTPSIFCVSLAVQCDTNSGHTCDGGQYC